MDGREAEELAKRFFEEIKLKVQGMDDEEEIRQYVKFILNILFGECEKEYHIMAKEKEAQAIEEMEEIHVPFFWDINYFSGRGAVERKG